MKKHLPSKVKIVEVGMRDGLQNEKLLIPTEEKIKLIDKLVHAGLKEIEITSFVSPKWIPQLADSLKVAQAFRDDHRVNFSALVPNLQGLKMAMEAEIKTIAVFMSVTEAHNQKNLNKSRYEAFVTLEEVTKKAISQGMRVRAYLSTVFGCPFEGKVNKNRVSDLTEKLLNLGIYEVSLGDTIGVANPLQVEEVLGLLMNRGNKKALAVHFHDTRGCGLANSLTALRMGITTFDSSFGGLGGCPYAPGASGNVATEDLGYMFEEMGIDCGINLERLMSCSLQLQNILGKNLPSKYLQASIGPKACNN
jgi:hydroxymethylglutaryl-CoA lyase